MKLPNWLKRLLCSHTDEFVLGAEKISEDGRWRIRIRVCPKCGKEFYFRVPIWPHPIPSRFDGRNGNGYQPAPPDSRYPAGKVHAPRPWPLPPAPPRPRIVGGVRIPAAPPRPRDDSDDFATGLAVGYMLGGSTHAEPIPSDTTPSFSGGGGGSGGGGASSSCGSSDSGSSSSSDSGGSSGGSDGGGGGGGE